MRIYDIALFVLIFNLSLSMFNQLGVFQVGVSSPYIAGKTINEWAMEKKETVGKIVEGGSSEKINPEAVLSWFNAIYKFTINAIPEFFQMIYDATIGVYPLLLTLGIPKVLALPLATITYLVYTAGLLQLFMRTGVRDFV